MLVICAGMYRACSTWQYEVAAHLVDEYLGGRRLGYLTGDEFSRIDVGHDNGWAVLKSHEEHPAFRRRVNRGKATVLYAYRDVRDVVYSLMHKRRCTFDELLRQGMLHQVLANDSFWSRRPGVLVQRYEDLVARPVEGVVEIAKRLGIGLTRVEAESIAETYSLEANRERVERLSKSLSEAGVDLNDPTNAQYYDSASLLHWNHLRLGGSGSWRFEATLAERRILGAVCDSWLAEHDYETPTASGRARLLESFGERKRVVRGAIACASRCLSLRYPRTARLVKRAMFITLDIPAASPDTLARDSGTKREEAA